MYRSIQLIKLWFYSVSQNLNKSLFNYTWKKTPHNIFLQNINMRVFIKRKIKSYSKHADTRDRTPI